MARLPTFDAARTVAFGGLSGSYADLGAVMGSPVYGFIIYNATDVDVQISFDDGSTDGPIIPAGKDFSSDRIAQIWRKEDMTFVLEKGAQVQVKEVSSASSGDVILNVVRE